MPIDAIDKIDESTPRPGAILGHGFRPINQIDPDAVSGPSQRGARPLADYYGIRPNLGLHSGKAPKRRPGLFG